MHFSGRLCPVRLSLKRWLFQGEHRPKWAQERNVSPLETTEYLQRMWRLKKRHKKRISSRNCAWARHGRPDTKKTGGCDDAENSEGSLKGGKKTRVPRHRHNLEGKDRRNGIEISGKKKKARRRPPGNEDIEERGKTHTKERPGRAERRRAGRNQ